MNKVMQFLTFWFLPAFIAMGVGIWEMTQGHTNPALGLVLTAWYWMIAVAVGWEMRGLKSIRISIPTLTVLLFLICGFGCAAGLFFAPDEIAVQTWLGVGACGLPLLGYYLSIGVGHLLQRKSG